MKLTRLWLVVKPTKSSTLNDICFSVTAHEMELQFKGGLKAAEIDGMYTGHDEAEQRARFLLAQVKKGQ